MDAFCRSMLSADDISAKRVAMRAVLEEERCKHQARLAEAEEHKSSL